MTITDVYAQIENYTPAQREALRLAKGQENEAELVEVITGESISE